MRTIYLIILAFLLCQSAKSQITRGYVYLKDGSVIKGKIQESFPLTEIKVKSKGNMWVFQISDIQRIVHSQDLRRFIEVDTTKSKIFVVAESGIMIGNTSDGEEAKLMFHTMLSYPISDKVYIGFGAGVEFLNETHVPVFVKAEYKFRNSRLTPFLFLKAGYQIPVENSRTYYSGVVPDKLQNPDFWRWYNNANGQLKAKGGIILNPGIGFVNMFHKNFGLSYSFGYRYSVLRYGGQQQYNLDVNYNQLVISLGILFK